MEAADTRDKWINNCLNSQVGTPTPEDRRKRNDALKAQAEAKKAAAAGGTGGTPPAVTPRTDQPAGGPAPANPLASSGGANAAMAGLGTNNPRAQNPNPGQNQGVPPQAASPGAPPGGRPAATPGGPPNRSMSFVQRPGGGPPGMGPPAAAPGGPGGELKQLLENFCSAAWDGNVDLVKQGLQHPQIGGIINLGNSRGQSALYCAARNGHVGVVAELAMFDGIDLNFQVQEHGGTPLHAASFNQRVEVVAALLIRGANADLPNNTGLSARSEAKGEAIDIYEIYNAQGVPGLIQKFPHLAHLAPPQAAQTQPRPAGRAQSMMFKQSPLHVPAGQSPPSDSPSQAPARPNEKVGLGPQTDNSPPLDIPGGPVRQGTFLIVFPDGGTKLISSNATALKEALHTQLERRQLTIDKLHIKTPDHRVIPYDMPVNEIPHSCCFLTTIAAQPAPSPVRMNPTAAQAIPQQNAGAPSGGQSASPIFVPRATPAGYEIPEVRQGTFMLVFPGTGEKKTIALSANPIREAFANQLERKGLNFDKVWVKNVNDKVIPLETPVNQIQQACCFITEIPKEQIKQPTPQELEERRLKAAQLAAQKAEEERQRIIALREKQKQEQEQWEREQERKRLDAERGSMYEQTEPSDDEDGVRERQERELEAKVRMSQQKFDQQSLLHQATDAKAGGPSEQVADAPKKRVRRNPFQKMGYEPQEDGEELKKRLLAMYAKLDEKPEIEFDDADKEKKPNTSISLSSICLTHYPDPEFGRPGWKIEQCPKERIIPMTGPEDLFQSEENDATFLLVASEVNVVAVRYVGDQRQWYLLLAEGDELNLAFNSADMLPTIFPWDPIYSLVVNGLPRRILLKIEQAVRPKIPNEPEEQARVNLFIALFNSLSNLSAHMMKFYKALNPKVHALEEIRQFSTNSTAGPIIYSQVMPALINLMLDGFDDWTLFGHHHPWDYVYACTSNDAVEDHVQLQFNTSLTQIKNTKQLEKNPNFRLIAFFCAGISNRQLLKWIKLLYANEYQTNRFFKSHALWLVAKDQIFELIALLDGLPLKLTGMPPGAEEAQAAEENLLGQFADELAAQARAEIDAKMLEYGIEVPDVKLSDHVDVEKLEKDWEDAKVTAANTAAAISEGAVAAYNTIEPELQYVRDVVVDRANRLIDYFFSDDAYLD